MNILARVLKGGPMTTDTPDAGPTPAQIAAGVRRGPAFQRLERELKDLIEQRDGLTTEMHAVQHQIGGRNGYEAARLARDISQKLNVIALRMTAAKTALRGRRAERAELVAIALGPTRQAAAARILAAIEELHGACELLNAGDREIRKAGGTVDYAHAPATGQLEAVARRIAGDS